MQRGLAEPDYAQGLHAFKCVCSKSARLYIASLVQEFKAHDKSRESIEMALDEILKQKMKIRHKYGFKPPKSGRRTDVEGDPTVSQVSEACSFCVLAISPLALCFITRCFGLLQHMIALAVTGFICL